MKPPTMAQLTAQCARWNAANPVGTPVNVAQDDGNILQTVTQSAKMYARRAKFRTKRDGEFRYPFGLLTVVDLMDRVLKIERRPRARKKAA